MGAYISCGEKMSVSRCDMAMVIVRGRGREACKAWCQMRWRMSKGRLGKRWKDGWAMLV